jgi:hypothetical protein
MGGFEKSQVSTKPTNDTNLDAFGRQRMSLPVTIFENKNLYSKNADRWYESINGAGTTITHNLADAGVDLTVGTENGSFAIRQSAFVTPYVPGKSHLIAITFNFGAEKTGVTKRAGYFDEQNGIFLEQNGVGTYLVIRKNGIDNKVIKGMWSVDKLNGSGESGKTLDLSKAQIFFIDMQWLGVGVVRCGFDIEEMIDVHHFKHANIETSAYMSQPTLPIRYEIRNTAITASPTTFLEICSSVSSEGGFLLPGYERIFNTGPALSLIDVTARVPILAVRLIDATTLGKLNRKLGRFLQISCYAETNGCLFELEHVHGDYAITATWNRFDNRSGLESAINPSAVTDAGGGFDSHIVRSVPVAAGKDGGEKEANVEFINNHSFIAQNLDSTKSEMFVIYASSFATQAAKVWASLDMLEVD